MADDQAPKDATEATLAANRNAGGSLPFHDRTDFDRVERGRLADVPTDPVVNDGGWPVWNLADYAFVVGDAPDSVHPSLWRQAHLNNAAGLFEVADGFYQVRGLDLSNVTFVAGDTGWIVIDPLTSAETARAALDLVTATLGERPIHAVSYTHSHVDHFAGVHGVIDRVDVDEGRVQVIAPEGFLHAAISENVIAGNVMARRASYMYGALLPRGPKGHVDAGLGKGVPFFGRQGLIPPTDDIVSTGEERTIDGVRIVFQITPGTEAPAEMNFFFPDRRVLCMAENCTATLHNLYTLRGAQVRDALAWSKYVDEAIELFGADTDVLFASHHWPRWGNDDALTYLARQRDAYRYLHDQTMRLANHGLTMNEIAESLTLPDTLAEEFYNRDYYGTVSHNAKAVYQRYLGWFDGNPAHLHPLPPTDAARRYVDYMGGADEVLRKARESFERADYRWVAEVVNHVVFADPTNTEARHLQADTLEQLGYQAESGPWRDFYLSGAQELRDGLLGIGGGSTASPDVVQAMTTEMLFDYLAVRLNGPEAAGRTVELAVEVTDRDEVWLLGLQNGTLRSVAGRRPDAPVATLRLTHDALAALATGRTTWEELVEGGGFEVDGDRAAVDGLVSLFDTFAFWFDIVTP